MKKIIFALFIIVTVSNSYGQSRVLRLNLTSHNETNDPSFGVDYTNAQDWTDVKTKLNMLVDTLEFYNAKYNLQCESNFIQANLNHDNGATVTTDFLETMENHSNIEVDPHNHVDLDNTMNPNYNPYNYSDLAKLLDSTGITRVTTVGGYIYLNSDWTYPTMENWTNWDGGIDGNFFPNYTWTPDVLWGGGTGNHVNDPFALGMWRPAGPTALTFINHSASNTTAIGNGCEWIIQDNTDIDSLVSTIQTHVDYFQNTLATDADMFICGSVVFNLRYSLTAGYIENVCAFIRKINPMVQNGTIQWQTIYEKFQAWQTMHPGTADSYILFCDDLTGLAVEEIENEFDFDLYPNPSNGNMIVSTEQEGELTIFDSNGKNIFSNKISFGENRLDFSDLAKGIYLLKISHAKGEKTKVWIKE